MTNPRPTLDLAAADPRSLDQCGRDDLTALLVQVAGLQSAIAARLVALPAVPEQPPAPNTVEKLLTVAEAAALIRKSRRWFYRRARSLSFIVRVGGSTRVSEQGLRKWLERQGRR